MKIFKKLYRIITFKKVKTVVKETEYFTVNSSLRNAIDDLGCYGFVILNHNGLDLQDRTANALAWCKDNCKEQYFYTIDFFAKDKQNNDLIKKYKLENYEMMTILAFKDKEDYYSFHLFFN